MQHTHGSGVAWADAESNGRLVLLHGWLFFKRNLVLDGLKLGLRTKFKKELMSYWSRMLRETYGQQTGACGDLLMHTDSFVLGAS
jgi:hypothetical protein